MADKGVLKIIRDFEQVIKEGLECVPSLVVDLHELRQDEIDFLEKFYGERYCVEIGPGFVAPGNNNMHPYAIIRRKE